MGEEIEGKWMISKVPELVGISFSEIDQLYLEVSNPQTEEIRIRAKGDKYFLTIKKGTGVKREESEVEIPLKTYNSLSFVSMNWISKNRYEIPDGKYVIELDIYKRNLEGLVIAEIEFGAIEEKQSYNVPEWFGKEVTNDKNYKNKNLAINGIPKD